ncbi:hypothetical protein [Pendulispora albinea]|uniref:PET hydrolase/cutinase-like domain-containing protein n=1 Tax=Pendulispora albinea TaxID=2741071 RepID=A0ABZ2LU00_9BACT
MERATVKDGAGAAKYELFYPSGTAGGTVRHPILAWGNGTDATVAEYSRLLAQMASWGFAVIASTSANTGTGQEMLASVDWLVAANDDPASAFYGTLDPTKIGVFGHSQGAGGSMRAFALANEPGSGHRPMSTLVPIELPAQKWICVGNSDPECKARHWFDGAAIRSGSVFFVNGSRDSLISPSTQAPGTEGQQSMAAFFDAVPDAVPKARATLAGADHNDIQDACKILCSVPQAEYFGYLVAWMRYRLMDDPIASLAFAGPDAELVRNAGWENATVSGLGVKPD